MVGQHGHRRLENIHGQRIRGTRLQCGDHLRRNLPFRGQLFFEGGQFIGVGEFFKQQQINDLFKSGLVGQIFDQIPPGR